MTAPTSPDTSKPLLGAPTEPGRQMLRHTLATLAYRAGKAVRGAPDGFAEFQIAPGSRTPAQILAHLGDLLDWALSMAEGQQRWSNSTPLAWDLEVARFFLMIERFDAYLASESPLAASPEMLFQGPVADSLWHAGQIAMLRRLAGAPIRGENYAIAEIAAGTVGAEQSAPKFEFD